MAAAARVGAAHRNIPSVVSAWSQRKPFRNQNEHHDRTAKKRTEQDCREDQVCEQMKHCLALHGCTTIRLAGSNRTGSSFISAIRTTAIQIWTILPSPLKVRMISHCLVAGVPHAASKIMKAI
jgi:hypothetical protein